MLFEDQHISDEGNDVVGFDGSATNASADINVQDTNGNSNSSDDVSTSEERVQTVKKRKLPSWFENTENISKRGKTDKIDSNENIDSGKISETERISLEEEPQVKIKTEPIDAPLDPIDSDNNLSDENREHKVAIKTEPEDTAGEATGSHNNDNNTVPDLNKPVKLQIPVKVEVADATSTTRQSCKFGIRCYRRNPLHRAEEAHPGDSDYKRPIFPTPPLGTPNCPYGNACYRRNPVHFEQYNHPADTDFHKNYRMRLRQRLQKQRQQPNAASGNSSDLDDYDFEDPFINDDSEDDYIPSEDDGGEDEDYDDCDKDEE